MKEGKNAEKSEKAERAGSWQVWDVKFQVVEGRRVCIYLSSSAECAKVG